MKLGILAPVSAVAAGLMLVSATIPAFAQDQSLVAQPVPSISDVQRQHPEAQRISANQLSWDNGNVIMTWPSSQSSSQAAAAAPSPSATNSGGGVTTQATLNGCPEGWACFYEHNNYGGRRVQFQSRGCQNLNDYGFDNMATSWRFNRTGSFSAFDAANCPTTRLWGPVGEYSSSTNVGSAANDRASSFNIS